MSGRTPVEIAAVSSLIWTELKETEIKKSGAFFKRQGNVLYSVLNLEEDIW